MTSSGSEQTVLVVGAGSIGLFVQFLLQEQMGSVLIARQHSFEALSAQPLTVTGAREGSQVLNCQTWERLPPVTGACTVFVAVKAHEVGDVLDILKEKIPAGSAYLLCQNGVGIYEQARQVMPDGKLFRLGCWMGIQRRRLDHIHVAGVYKFDLSGSESDLPFMQTWKQTLEQLGVPVTVGSQPRLAEWQKALWNITVNGLCSILNEKNGVILDDPDIRHVADAIVEETIAVAALDGIELGTDDRQAVFKSLESTRGNVNATLQDLRAGRHPELEYFNGAVVRIARRHDQKAPLNETIMSLVTFLEKTRARKEV